MDGLTCLETEEAQTGSRAKATFHNDRRICAVLVQRLEKVEV